MGKYLSLSLDFGLNVELGDIKRDGVGDSLGLRWRRLRVGVNHIGPPA